MTKKPTEIKTSERKEKARKAKRTSNNYHNQDNNTSKKSSIKDKSVFLNNAKKSTKSKTDKNKVTKSLFIPLNLIIVKYHQ